MLNVLLLKFRATIETSYFMVSEMSQLNHEYRRIEIHIYIYIYICKYIKPFYLLKCLSFTR